MHAAEASQSEVFQYLCLVGANMSHMNAKGQNALERAAAVGDVRIVPFSLHEREPTFYRIPRIRHSAAQAMEGLTGTLPDREEIEDLGTNPFQESTSDHYRCNEEYVVRKRKRDVESMMSVYKMFNVIHGRV